MKRIMICKSHGLFLFLQKITRVLLVIRYIFLPSKILELTLWKGKLTLRI